MTFAGDAVLPVTVIGDMIFGDRDGLRVVPREVGSVFRALERAATGNRVRSALRNARRMPLPGSA